MKTFLLSLKIYFSWLMLLVFFNLLGNIFFGNINDLTTLANWDGRHFLDISQNGYANNIHYAFFPLYPLLISFTSKLTTLPLFYSALAINLISVWGLIYFFLKYLNITNRKISVLYYFLIFPTSFYLITIYSEALFLLITISAFYFLYKNKLLPAILIGSLSALVRISGVALLIALSFAIVTQNITKSKKIIYLIILYAGLLLYMLFLYLKTGNPFYFLISEKNWDREISIPGENILNLITFLIYYGLKPEAYSLLFDLLFTIFGLGLALKSLKNLKAEETIFTLSALALPLLTSLLLSMPRFLLIVFPLFIIISKIKNNVFKISYVIISLTLLFLYLNFFTRNIWVS